MPQGHTPEAIAAELAKFSAAVADLTPATKTANTPAPEPGSPISSKVGALSTGAHQPSLSVEEASAGRETWAKTFALPTDRVMTMAEADAALAAHMARYDAALRADGISVPKAPDPKLVKAHEQFNVPLDAKPQDYTATLPRDFTPTAGTTAELSELAAALQFDPHLGSGFISTLAEQAIAYRSMDDGQKAAWLSGQRATSIRRYGEKTFGEMKQRAVDLLKSTGKPIAMALASSPVLDSVWVVSTLSTHAQTLAAFRSRK